MDNSNPQEIGYREAAVGETHALFVSMLVKHGEAFEQYLRDIIKDQPWEGCISWLSGLTDVKGAGDLALFAIYSFSLNHTWHHEVVPFLLENFSTCKQIKVRNEVYFGKDAAA